MRKRSKEVPEKNLKFTKSFFDFCYIRGSVNITAQYETVSNIKAIFKKFFTILKNKTKQTLLFLISE